MALSTLPEAPSSPRITRSVSVPKSSKSGGGAFRIGATLLLVAFLCIGLFRMFARPPEPTGRMIVAAGRDLAPGCRLGFHDLHMMSVPESYYTKDMALKYTDLVGSYTKTFVAMGEPVLKTQLLPGQQSVEAQLRADQRAFTLRLNDDQLVDHQVKSGDSVDVIVTTGSGSKHYTKTLCQDVPVLLATPKEILTSDKLKSSENNKITLALSPADVEKVAQASETGKIRLVLRNSQSRMTAALTGADDDDLLPPDAFKIEKSSTSASAVMPPFLSGTAPLPPPPMPPAMPSADLPPAAPIQWVVDIFKGAVKETHAFEQQP